jgi:hypothetical protein
VAVAVTLAVVVTADVLPGGVDDGVSTGLAVTCVRAGVLVAVPVTVDSVAVAAPACAVGVPEGAAVTSLFAPEDAAGVPVEVVWAVGVSAGWMGVLDVAGDAVGVVPGVAACVAECRHTAPGSMIVG